MSLHHLERFIAFLALCDYSNKLEVTVLCSPRYMTVEVLKNVCHLYIYNSSSVCCYLTSSTSPTIFANSNLHIQQQTLQKSLPSYSMPRYMYVKKLSCCQCKKPTFPYKLYETCHNCQHAPCGDCSTHEMPINAGDTPTRTPAKPKKDNEDPDEERHLGLLTNLQRLNGSSESLVLKKQKSTFL